MGTTTVCCQGKEMSRGGQDKLKKIDIDGKYPTVFYHKNYIAPQSEKDYFYNTENLLVNKSSVKIIPIQITREYKEDDNEEHDCGDELQLSQSQIEGRRSSFRESPLLSEITQEFIGKKYRFEKVLGEGAQGKVKVASLRADETKKYAIKSIPRSLFNKSRGTSSLLRSLESPQNVESVKKEELKTNNSNGEEERQHMFELLQNEIKGVMGMEHPNIVQFYQCVYDNDYLNIVMELVRGKPLSNFIENKKGYCSEQECQIIMRQIMRAILYFHSKNIVHRDLKLENVMVHGLESGKIEDLRVKLIDFGVSKFTQNQGEKINLNTYCGTLNFMAPEVISGNNYDMSCDLWSVGVIAYNIISGVPPFVGKDDKDLVRRIATCNYDFDAEVWDTVSKPAKDWIKGLLKQDPKKRMSPDEALEHQWLSSESSAQITYPIHPKVLMNLHGCDYVHELHFQLLNVFTQYLNDQDIKDIRETFQSIDRDHSGSIDCEELKQAFQQLNKDQLSKNGNKIVHKQYDVADQNMPNVLESLTQDQIEEIHQKIDQDNNGTIEYSEFLAHSLTEEHLSEKNVRLFFEVMLPVQKGLEITNLNVSPRSNSTRESIGGSFKKKFFSNQKKNNLQVNTPLLKVDSTKHLQVTTPMTKFTSTNLQLLPSLVDQGGDTLKLPAAADQAEGTSQMNDSMNLSFLGDYASAQKQFIDATIIHKYFQKCGKIIRLEILKDMMTECGEKLGLEEFNGESQISFELFHKFMTFLLEKKKDQN